MVKINCTFYVIMLHNHFIYKCRCCTFSFSSFDNVIHLWFFTSANVYISQHNEINTHTHARMHAHTHTHKCWRLKAVGCIIMYVWCLKAYSQFYTTTLLSCLQCSADNVLHLHIGSGYGYKLYTWPKLTSGSRSGSHGQWEDATYYLSVTV